MKYFCNYIILFVGITILSCSSDECSQDGWVGTFTKTNEDCDNGGVPLFEDSATYFEGSCDNCVSTSAKKDLMFDENCSITIETPLFGDLITTLDGNTLRVSAPLLNCSATYVKQ